MKKGYSNITALQAKELMESGESYLLLDVRDKGEYDMGHINGAFLLPYSEISDRAEEEITDKNRLILTYCQTGRRSAIAAAELVGLGYTRVCNLGGISDWPFKTTRRRTL